MEPKCVPRLFLGSLQAMRRSVIGQFPLVALGGLQNLTCYTPITDTYNYSKYRHLYFDIDTYNCSKWLLFFYRTHLQKTS